MRKFPFSFSRKESIIRPVAREAQYVFIYFEPRPPPRQKWRIELEWIKDASLFLSQGRAFSLSLSQETERVLGHTFARSDARYGFSN